MDILIKLLATIGALAIFTVIFVTWKFRSAVKARMALVDKEYATTETADWFGKTGLDEETERELPRYLRREFGETLFEQGALQANDLIYLGAFDEPIGVAHYWRITSKHNEDEPYYAHVIVEANGETCTGWGDRKPPLTAIEEKQP
ncbi:MAG TPA: hypothetical protein PL131_07260 [Methylotenera sp.]|nr:hypothetical protein [Methylotenera sp.]HPH05658.1 hypothetical protein [Methylotenera sp.]HPN01338.1 hypothetical protein [Methylotenera sp.]